MSAVHGTQLFLPRMLAQGGGAHIVNIASVAGLVAFPYTAPYSATKFALVGMSQALSCELWGSGISVTVVCPGMVRSRLVTDGTLRLPDPWPRIFDRAYATLADDPDRIARAILRAVERDQPLVVPATLLPQLWRLERLGGGAFHRGARQLTRALRGLGGWMAARRTP
jgi:short-subunit dehydrogenase